MKSEADRDAAFQDLRAFIEAGAPWSVAAEMPSPIQGEKGNIEFLFHVN